MIKKIALKLIRLYQKTLSPSTGFFAPIFSERFCRFSPTCSEYTYQCIEKYGIIKGILLGFWRINRCNPFSAGGFDPPPKPEKVKDLVFRGFIVLVFYFIFFFFLYKILVFLKR